MSQVPDDLRALTRSRAGGRCEYCLVAEVFLVWHEADHIIAVQHRGVTSAENLALACFDCNRHKGPNLASVDPVSGEVVRLFHPREDNWAEHFQIEGAWITGLTPKGRATAALLQFNTPQRRRTREELQAAGRYP